jgi:hypothetical protein
MSMSARTGAAWLILALAPGLLGEDRVPTIHVTDLYRPHGDPDDHWDLASQFALAHRGAIELKGVLIDYTRAVDVANKGPDGFGDPDVVAVAQMNVLAGCAAPVMIGSPHPMTTPRDAQHNASIGEHSGINGVLGILRSSPRPVVIHITGTGRDIAVAANKEPELFAEKCAGIYLNAGTAVGASRDYNVNLDPAGFAAIFHSPCPVYWAPCVMAHEPGKTRETRGEYSSWYAFRQDAILLHLSDGLQNFFAYMYRDGHEQHRQVEFDRNWLRHLNGSVEQAVIAEHSRRERAMWCTAGFLHATGNTVTAEGDIVPLAQAQNKAVFSFDPVQVDAANGREIKWRPGVADPERFIIHIRDQQHYESAMAKALRSLLSELP